MSLIEVRDLSKNYGGLRPLRVRKLSADPGEVVVIDGPDRLAAAVLTDLLTGTTLPETGTVVVDGQATSALAGQEEWLAFLDRFGIVNERVVLLDELTVAGNLAVPLTLDVDPLPAEIRARVEAIAGEVGLDAGILDQPLHRTPPLVRLLVRLGRAVAHTPAVLLVEHPTAELAALREAEAAGAALGRVSGAHARMTTLIVSSDGRLPRDVATRHLTWRAATGELSDTAGWRKWFS